MKLDMESVLKAGGLAAVAAILMGLITSVIGALPFLGGAINIALAPFYCLGSFLIPIGAGMAYGYFAPGKENLAEGIVGGILTGGVSGILYGLLQGLGTLFLVGVKAGALTAISSGCGFAFSGILFGAIGGLIWPQVQDMVEGR